MTKVQETKRKGTLEGPFTDANGRKFWRGKVRLKDGTRGRVNIPEHRRYDEDHARKHLEYAQEVEDETNAIYNAKVAARASAVSTTPAPERGEDAEKWIKRYVDVLIGLGLKDKYAKEMRSSWTTWFGRYFAGKGMREITTADVRAGRDNLTRAWRDEEIGAKRAMNLWLLVATPFSRAFSGDTAKYVEVRVGDAGENPALNVEPPVTQADILNDERERQACSPALFVALMNCDERPLDERRWDAVMAYSGLSPSEFYGLRKSDIRVDAERPHFLVQRGRDMKEGNATTTKQRQRNRKAPIHPEIRPLLRLILEGVDGANDYVFRRMRANDVERVRDVESRVHELREHLTIAGADPELIEGTDTLKPFDVRSWRTTFATWAWSAGYDSAWVDVWLGHKPKTTAAKHYAKDVPHFEDVAIKPPRPGVVPPFPPLPSALLEDGEPVTPSVTLLGKYTKELCEGRELNPYRSYPTGT